MPPPIIDGARLELYAHNDDAVVFTDKIDLFVGSPESGEMKRQGQVPNLAICREYAPPREYLLFFCDEKWAAQGVIGFDAVETAKRRAERGYRGIDANWNESPYSCEEVRSYLSDVRGVDPDTEWWAYRCSFCNKEIAEVSNIIASERVMICNECVAKFAKRSGPSDA